MNKIDDKTKEYLNTVKTNLGYLGYNWGWDGIKDILKNKNLLHLSELELVTTYDGYVNSSDIEVYKYKNTNGDIRYCAELCYQTHIDDYCIETHIFDRLPSKKSVFAVRKIRDIEFNMEFKNLKPEFKCWECGRRVHWVDIEGDFSRKAEMLLEKYCGC